MNVHGLLNLWLAYFSELHLVHAFSSVPMQESLAPEHSSELLTDALEELLDGSAVSNESAGHLQTTWRDVANCSLDVIGDPLHEVRAVLVLHIKHLFVDFLHGHAATENGSYGQVTAVARVAGSHHVLGVKHLLGQFGNCEGSVLLGTTTGERGKARHEEVKARERNHVYSQLAKVSIQLSRESEACCDTAHCGRNEVVEVAIGWCGELEGTETDVVKSFIVNAVCLVCVFYKLVN